MNTPILNVTTKCKSRTEYDGAVPAENCRLQVGSDSAAFIDLGLRGDLAGLIVNGKNYQLTITEITA
jgi:hypothetical protein